MIPISDEIDQWDTSDELDQWDVHGNSGDRGSMEDITTHATEETPEPSITMSTTNASPTEETPEPPITISTTNASPTELTPESSSATPTTNASPTEPTSEPSSSTSTTTAAPITPPAPPCPDSIFTANDLKDLIRHTTNSTQTLESIKNSFYEDAVNMRDTHVKALTMFSVWFIDQPNHLKQILENLSHNRKKIELNLNQIAKHLKIAITLDHYQTVQTNIVELEEYSNRTITMCKLSCPPHQLLSRSPLFIADLATKVPDNDHYCGKLAEVYEKIKAKLMTFTKSTQDSFKARIKQDNETYIKDIEELENHLKDTALQKFGRTMYDVLNLIDNYHTLEKRSNVDEVRDEVIRNKENIASIELKLLKLRDYSKRVMEKCRKCNMDYALGSYSLQYQNGDKDLLEQMLEENEEELMNMIMDEYHRIFEGLDDDLKFDSPEKINKYIKNLEKLHDEVVALTKTETETFSKMSDTFLNLGLKDQELIADGAEELSKTLEAIEENLKNIEANIH